VTKRKGKSLSQENCPRLLKQEMNILDDNCSEKMTFNVSFVVHVGGFGLVEGGRGASLHLTRLQGDTLVACFKLKLKE